MRYMGLIIAVGLTLVVLTIGAIFTFDSRQIQEVTVTTSTAVPPTAVPQITPVNDSEMSLQATMEARVAVYQSQITQLEENWQDHNLTYQGQIDTLTTELAAAQQTLAQLKAQEADLQNQVANLEATRNSRLQQYQTQLQQAQAQYSALFAELQAHRDQLQTQLLEANAQLGR